MVAQLSQSLNEYENDIGWVSRMQLFAGLVLKRKEFYSNLLKMFVKNKRNLIISGLSTIASGKAVAMIARLLQRRCDVVNNLYLLSVM